MGQKKRVIVTGGSGGIGGAIVRALAEAGWAVMAGYRRNKGAAEALAETLQGEGHDVRIAHLDVSNEASVKDFVAQAACPGIDALVNCAGVDRYGLLQDVSLEDWRCVMDTNVTGTFLVTQAVLPLFLEKKKGIILNLSSIWGARGAACEVPYSTSKGAVDAFTKALAQEVAWSGIRVNALAPGVVATSMFDHLHPEDRAATLEEIPFQRPATAEEIAHYAVFLLSEDAAYMTGQIITPAGGFVI